MLKATYFLLLLLVIFATLAGGSDLVEIYVYSDNSVVVKFTHTSILPTSSVHGELSVLLNIVGVSDFTIEAYGSLNWSSREEHILELYVEFREDMCENSTCRALITVNMTTSSERGVLAISTTEPLVNLLDTSSLQGTVQGKLLIKGTGVYEDLIAALTKLNGESLLEYLILHNISGILFEHFSTTTYNIGVLVEFRLKIDIPRTLSLTEINLSAIKKLLREHPPIGGWSRLYLRSSGGGLKFNLTSSSSIDINMYLELLHRAYSVICELVGEITIPYPLKVLFNFKPDFTRFYRLLSIFSEKFNLTTSIGYINSTVSRGQLIVEVETPRIRGKNATTPIETLLALYEFSKEVSKELNYPVLLNSRVRLKPEPGLVALINNTEVTEITFSDIPRLEITTRREMWVPHVEIVLVAVSIIVLIILGILVLKHIRVKLTRISLRRVLGYSLLVFITLNTIIVAVYGSVKSQSNLEINNSQSVVWDYRPGVSVKGFESWQDYSGYVPLVDPVTVPVFVNALSNNISDSKYPMIINTVRVELPRGEFSKILARVEVSVESIIPGRPGVNYDRPLWVFIEGIPLVVGTTAQKSNYVVVVDVTHLYPLLVNSVREFTLLMRNWIMPEKGLTGYFKVNITLLYYPGKQPDNTPDIIIPIWSTGREWITIDSSKPTLTWTITLPTNTTQAYLYLYLEGASREEFWWMSTPIERLVITSSNNTTIAVTQPFPFIYTGGIIPYFWHPVPAINTYAFHPLIIDITPYLYYLVRTGNLTITMTNIGTYWFIGGFLALKTTSGEVKYEFLGDNPLIIRREENTTSSGVVTYTSTVEYTNTAKLKITTNNNTYIYTTIYHIMLRGSQRQVGGYSEFILTQKWYYSSSWLNYNAIYSAISTFKMNQSKLVEPEAPLHSASPESPVPARVKIEVTVNHEYNYTQSLSSSVETTTIINSTQLLKATGKVELYVYYTTPTSYVVRNVNYADTETYKTMIYSNERSVRIFEYTIPILTYTYYRYTKATTTYPPLRSNVVEDTLTLNYAETTLHTTRLTLHILYTLNTSRLELLVVSKLLKVLLSKYTQ